LCLKAASIPVDDDLAWWAPQTGGGGVTGLLVVFVVLTILAAAGSAVIALLAWQRRSVPGALSFATVMMAAGFWCAAYAAELSSSSLTAKLFFERLNYVGVVLVPPSWLLFSLLYSGAMRRRSALTIAPST